MKYRDVLFYKQRMETYKKMKEHTRILLTLSIVLIYLCAFAESSLAEAPYPTSTVITGIEYDSQITRAASGSDNWPTTWADDDHLYTAFGDGWGFVGAQTGSLKEFLGISRVTGSATNYSGEDLSTVKYASEGSPQIKGTGILMVDGVLYLWSRRDNGTLRKSVDHGQSWQDTGIGIELANEDFYSQTPLNFGKNYAGARDNYVYIYGNNHRVLPGNIYLYRIPKDKIDDEFYYEYFKGLDGSGNPVWSFNISDRIAVFTDNSNYAGDPRIIYNAGIGRYILTTYYDNGGMGIFDAPEPWGPWTTVFYDNWDQGETFEYNFPTKWISADGKTMYMIFSGTGINDAFCVRKVTLTINASGDTIPPAAPKNLESY